MTPWEKLTWPEGESHQVRFFGDGQPDSLLEITISIFLEIKSRTEPTNVSRPVYVSNELIPE